MSFGSSRESRTDKDGSSGTTSADGVTQEKKAATADQQASGRQTNAVEPLRFKEGIPETDRYLFELRRKYDDNKGKGMWDPIAADYNQRFGVSFDRAALQMRLSRAKSKWVQWSERDVRLFFFFFFLVLKTPYISPFKDSSKTRKSNRC